MAAIRYISAKLAAQVWVGAKFWRSGAELLKIDEELLGAAGAFSLDQVNVDPYRATTQHALTVDTCLSLWNWQDLHVRR
jgi:hypothetical protein